MHLKKRIVYCIRITTIFNKHFNKQLMENFLSETKKHTLDFHGKGGDFFGIIIVNWLLTTLTLGLYYPWAKAKQLQFLYGETSLNNDRFCFSWNRKGDV